VDALHRLARRGFVELRGDYVPYLERSLEAPPDFPDQDAERSLWMGETGIRLVLQRLAPSQANLERLSELIAANEGDERCELMWGSPIQGVPKSRKFNSNRRFYRRPVQDRVEGGLSPSFDGQSTAGVGERVS